MSERKLTMLEERPFKCITFFGQPGTEFMQDCVRFWNNTGKKNHKWNKDHIPNFNQSYEDYILNGIKGDVNALINGRPDKQPFTFDKSGSHVWVHDANNERVLIFYFE